MDPTQKTPREDADALERDKTRRPARNPIDIDMHQDEPVVYGPDGSGEAVDRSRQPYGGAD